MELTEHRNCEAQSQLRILKHDALFSKYLTS
jgi:hypothetical protein